jgi:hypothetical protein
VDVSDTLWLEGTQVAGEPLSLASVYGRIKGRRRWWRRGRAVKDVTSQRTFETKGYYT